MVELKDMKHLLAAPMWAFTPAALASMPHDVVRTIFRALPMISDASAQRMALQHSGLVQIRDALEADAGDHDAFLLPPRRRSRMLWGPCVAPQLCRRRFGSMPRLRLGSIDI